MEAWYSQWFASVDLCGISLHEIQPPRNLFASMTTDSISNVEITRLLREWGAGDNDALERLIPHVYDELRRLARRYMRKERAGGSLQPTALVSEIFLRLVAARDIGWQDREHFFAIGSQLMRRVLVDAARARSSAKRGGQSPPPAHLEPKYLEQIPEMSAARDREIVAVDDALHLLAKVDDRKARVVELRFFGGLSVEETAGILKISPQSVMRDWKLAKAWLTRELKRSTTPRAAP
jgi:RNA polymerase sigma factor (TIGR02999 family)